MTIKRMIWCTAAVLFVWLPLAAEPLKVVTTLEVLRDIAQTVGGDRVVVQSLARGTQDPHFVEPRPSMVTVLRDADVLIRIGMGLEPWVDSAAEASRNGKIRFGRDGYLDVSQGIPKLDVIEGKIDGRAGHVHPEGNPHYWLDPENGIIIARTIAERFAALRPEHAAEFRRNYEAFTRELRADIERWRSMFAGIENRSIVTFHKSWGYFADRFGLEVVAEMEPLPGVPPSAKHLAEVARTMQETETRVILVENFYPERPARSLAARTGAAVVRVATDVGGSPEATKYRAMLDAVVRAVAGALSR
jgi:zinc/manganese transport system substrate-binding protein